MKKLASVITLLLLFGLAFNVEAGKRQKNRLCVSPKSAEKYFSASSHKRSIRPQSVDNTKVSVDGNIVVVEADPQLLILSNPFDLQGKQILFQPVLRSKLSYSISGAQFNSEATDTITLEDDDSVELPFRYFHFTYAGNTYDRCYINSNGNITFESGDPEPPNIETILSGPPRIAPFFADLDPETSGTVFVRQTEDFVAVTWLKVPEFFNQDQFAYGENTFQVVLYVDGRIDLIFSNSITATEAITGLVPGNGRSILRLVDFSRGTSRNRPFTSFIENFHRYESVDLPRLMSTLYGKHPDKYEFVTLLSNFDLNPLPGAQAFAINVQNSIQGIGNPSGKGRPIFKDTRKYGSDNLQNLTFLGNIHQYPSDPNELMSETYTSLIQILGHEVGHRWLSYVEIQRDGRNHDLLLGRDSSHWNFFLDSDGSLLEGNQILSKTATSFVTSKPFTGYSNLDLYLMGLFAKEEVGETFVVEGAGAFSPDFQFLPESSPEPNVSFRGTRIPIRIEDIIAANGERKPDVKTSPKSFRHLFVLITKTDRPATSEDIDRIEQLRREWERYFNVATRGRGNIVTKVD